MPRYFYTAKSLEGNIKSGILETRDEHQLARSLRQEGYILISANLEREKRKGGFEIPLPFLQGVSLSEKIMFTRNLRVMIGAGMSLPRALETLALQSKSKKFRTVLLEAVEEITKGKNFSDSLAKHTDVFSELFVSMIRVGEEAGTLEDVLKILANQMEREYELKSKVKGAMIYPAVIILAMIGIGIVMLIMVVPRLAETFEELDIELPVATRFVINLGSFLAEKWYFALLGILLFVILFRFILKTKIGKRSVDFITLRTPIIAPIIRKTNSAYTARTLSSLVTSGVPIIQSLEIVSGALGNIYFQEAMKDAAEKVRKGSKLSEALRPYDGLYHSTFMQMIEVGEETGETSGILSKLADFYETEVTNATKNLSAVIEPVLMLIIGGIVGFFAISMIQPIYSMLGAIK
jgi:type IV pilus assembly protein PilC